MVGYEHLSRAVRRRTDGEERKPPSKERVPGISDLNVSPFLFLRVLEGGIELIVRSNTSPTIP
jgi:hypothetical protein